jgi:hypothetical protein
LDNHCEYICISARGTTALFSLLMRLGPRPLTFTIHKRKSPEVILRASPCDTQTGPLPIMSDEPHITHIIPPLGAFVNPFPSILRVVRHYAAGKSSCVSHTRAFLGSMTTFMWFLGPLLGVCPSSLRSPPPKVQSQIVTDC